MKKGRPLDFAALIAPMAPAEFAGSYWAQRAVLLSGRPNAYEDLAFRLDDLRSELRATSIPEIKAQFFGADEEHREMRIEAAQIDPCFAAGMTICINGVDALLPPVAAQIQSLRRSMGFAGIMNLGCYWSPEGAGFGLHYDDHAVFILQLAGRKRWFYSRTPAAADPPSNLVFSPQALERHRADGFEITEPSADTLDESILEPGDLLYLPAGSWHRTSAVAGESLALTLRAIDGTPSDVVVRAFSSFMETERSWRRPLAIESADRGRLLALPAGVTAELEAKLALVKARVERLTVSDLVRSWAELQSWSSSADPWTGELRPEDVVAFRENVRALRGVDGDGEDRVYLYDGRSETEVRVAEHPWLLAALERGRFVALESTQWVGDVGTWGDAKPLIEELLSAGLAELVET